MPQTFTFRAEAAGLGQPDSLATWQRIAPFVSILTVTDAVSYADAPLRRDRMLMIDRHVGLCRTLCDLTMPASTTALNALASTRPRSLISLTLSYKGRNPSVHALMAAMVGLPRLSALHVRELRLKASSAVALFMAVEHSGLNKLTLTQCRTSHGIIDHDDDLIPFGTLIIDQSTAFGVIALTVLAPSSLTLSGSDGTGTAPLPSPGRFASPGRLCVDHHCAEVVPQLARLRCEQWYIAFPSIDAAPDLPFLERIIAALNDDTAFTHLRQIATSGQRSAGGWAATRRAELIAEMFAAACRRLGVPDPDADKASTNAELDDTFAALRGQMTTESQVRGPGRQA